MKVMLSGTSMLRWLWLGFFRKDSLALVSIFVSIPMSLYSNLAAWSAADRLVPDLLSSLTVWVLRRTEMLQGLVERHHSDLAERASDTLGNVALVQSFTRVLEAEVPDLRNVVDRLLGVQIPVLSWWALANTLTRTSTTLTTSSAILIVGLGLILAWTDDCGRNGHVHDLCRDAHPAARTHRRRSPIAI